MAKTSRKCRRCGSRDTKAGRRVEGYGNVCPPCARLCAFPVEAVAVGLAALVTGAIRLPLGFSSYREIRERRAADEEARRAAEELNQEGERVRLRAHIEELRTTLRRLPRRRRAEVALRIRTLTAKAGG
jgi:recombinational DNA repair protein (RecF pathway)